MNEDRLIDIEKRAHAARRLEDDVFALVEYARRAKEMLRDLQWGRDGECPLCRCDVWAHKKHADDCRLAALIR